MIACYVVNERIDSPDNIEIIRDQLSGILFLECENQYKLAMDAKDPAAEDYNISVFLENDEPWELQTENDNPFPLVNISLDKTTLEVGSTNTNLRKMKALFYIDCYAAGNYDGCGFAGRNAVIKAWKLGRIIRNIISAADYAYLKLRGIVGSRKITAIQTGMPKMEKSAGKICICRITLEVTYDETAPQTQGVLCEPMAVQISDSTGQVIIDFKE